MREARERVLAADDGLRLNLVDYGGGAGPPLLFLHGSFGHARQWDFVVEALGPEQRAFALDLPGHGGSGHAAEPERYRFDWLVRDVAVAVGAMPSAPVLAGQSIGSAIAMEYASRHPETLAGVVFMDIDPQPPEYQIEHLHDAGSPPPKEYDDFERAVAREGRVAPNASPEVHRHMATHGYRLEDGRWHQRFDQRFLRTVERWDEWGALRKVTAPALVMRGAESVVMAPGSVERMVELLPKARAEAVAGAGHQLHLEQPEGVAAVLLGFLSEIGGGER